MVITVGFCYQTKKVVIMGKYSCFFLGHVLNLFFISEAQVSCVP